MKSIAQADLIVTTPEKWDGVSRSWQNRNYVQQVTILIIDEIHLLGGNLNFLLLMLFLIDK
jgi:activating signal cointegrator complex subunit 3